MEEIISNIGDYWEIVTAIVTVASLIALKTKTDSDNKIIALISKIVDALALNFKK